MVATTAQEVAAAIHAMAVNTLQRDKVDLVGPPFVNAHEQVATGAPKIVEFTMTIEEKRHEGDYVELTLINPDTHNTDFHSATE